jgi:hypothetical protein
MAFKGAQESPEREKSLFSRRLVFFEPQLVAATDRV